MAMAEVGGVEIALIVVTYNSAVHFSRLRKAIDAQTFRNFALIVWDNASRPDQQPSPADLPDGARLVQSEENLGFAAANNRAADLVASKYVALLNPDAFPNANWLETLWTAAESAPHAGAFGSTQIMSEDENRFDGLGDCYHAAGVPWRGGYGWPRRQPARTYGTFSACAAAALYRREAWREAQGFDERFFAYCEDVDLGFRLRLLGWPSIQIGGAIVRHVGGASGGGRRSAFAVFHGTRNRLWTFVKCMPGILLWALLPAHILVTVVLLAISPFRGAGRATWRGVWSGLAGLRPILADRRSLHARRKTSLRALAKALTWNPLDMARRAPPKGAQGALQVSKWRNAATRRPE